MLRDFITSTVVIGAALLAAGTSIVPAQTPGNLPPANPPAANQSAAESRDPAAVTFTSPAGLVLHAVKPGSVSDYEAVIVALQTALSAAADAETQRIAQAWRVYKAAEADAKGSVLYVHLLQPAEPDVDYRPSLWLDQLIAGASPEVIAKYREAFAAPPSKLSLAELAHMAVAPVRERTNATPAGPTNGSPR